MSADGKEHARIASARTMDRDVLKTVTADCVVEGDAATICVRVTVRIAARGKRRHVGYNVLALVGTPTSIADQMEQWLATEACDGFNIMFPFLPAGLDDFVDRVVPELQSRRTFRNDDGGRTLRDHFGLPRPSNRFFPT